MSLEPDVVFAGGNFFTPPDAIARMRDLGLRVVVLYAASVDAVYGDIELLGVPPVGRTRRRPWSIASGPNSTRSERRSPACPDRAFLRARRHRRDLRPGGRLVPRRDDRACRRRPDHDRLPGQVRHLDRAPDRGRPRAHPAGRRPVRGDRRPGRRPTGLEGHDGGQERRHPPDRRSDRHAARTEAVPRSRAAGFDHPPGRQRSRPPSRSHPTPEVVRHGDHR